MGKYNTVKVKAQPDTVSYNGSPTFSLDDKHELISILATGMSASYYEKEDERATRFVTLIKKLAKSDPTFVAKALVYARTVFGQRSVTHLGAAALVKELSGKEIAKRFFTKRNRNGNSGGIVYRIDDMMEIVGAYFHLNKDVKMLPNAMKKGFAEAIANASVEELAKYQGKTRNISLVDIFNLVHPKPKNDKQAEAFRVLVKEGGLTAVTHEVLQSEAGRVVAEKVKSGKITKEEAEKELSEQKASNWKDLLANKQLGYLALLRNLRNIATVADDTTFNAALVQLQNENAIRKSLVFPHQIDIAIMVLLEDANLPTKRRNALITAANDAYEKAIPNLADAFSGTTAIVVDTSGSMTRGVVSTDDNVSLNATPADRAALMGATFAKGVGADLYQFGDLAKQMNYNPTDSVNTIKTNLLKVTQRHEVGHGTNFASVFNLMKGEKYDRVFFLSDMQLSDNYAFKASVTEYSNKHGMPYFYFVDLVGYGTTPMNPNNPKAFQLFGYSSATYEHAKKVEMDKNVVLKEIDAINL